MSAGDATLKHQGLPVFMKDTIRIMEWIRTLKLEEAKSLWRCNDRLAAQNFERFRDMNLERRLTPAILSYEGIQYQYMAPAVFEDRMLDYVQKNLRILSGFYGVLKPMDGVTAYRLEMQAKTVIDGKKGLYDFWEEKLYHEVADDSHVIINLASKEYSKCIEAYLSPKDKFITCIFGELEEGKIFQKGVYVKMARGEMVRFMAENNIREPEAMKEFSGLGYRFREDLSTDQNYIFIK